MKEKIKNKKDKNKSFKRFYFLYKNQKNKQKDK